MEQQTPAPRPGALGRYILGTLLLFCVVTEAPAAAPLRFSAIENSAFTDFATEVLTEAYRRAGNSIEVQPLPAARALKASSSGLTDGELYRTQGLEKRFPSLIPVNIPIFLSHWQAYTKNTPLEIHGWDSLRGVKIGIRRGIATTDKGTEGMNTVSTNTNESLFQLLVADRVDVIVLSKINAQKEINKADYPEVTLQSPAVQIVPVYHYLHKKNAALIPPLEEALLAMTNDGELAQITDKHWPWLVQ
ncbi:substrate-binding periplasmic protein [Aestuariirhabdus sp. LZHN29]|uniref:substrate-binding periplasmic protein n=1 Tax=Aestuariirhabdus sp. LZHN29 TaxID=3417462 RepID=UPI003CE8B478